MPTKRRPSPSFAASEPPRQPPEGIPDDVPETETPEEPDDDTPDEDENGSDADEAAAPAVGTEAVATNHTHPVTVPAHGSVRYEARIQILDAWQYHGGLRDAPAWIDRNWVAYANDEDQLRGIPAGPCLRVPLVTGEVAICRVGDFVARQEIRLTADVPGDIRVEVWPQEQFFKLFLPVPEKQFRPFMSGVTATIEHEPATSSPPPKPSHPAASEPSA